MDFYGFYTGKIFDAYRYLGGHLTEAGAVFRTFAPSAEKISLIGAFSGWEELPMERVHDGNFWECSVPGARAGMLYKYRIYTRGGRCLDHCDPYGFYMELRPNSASILWDQSAYSFRDQGWRSRPKNWREGPLNVYEVHLGSWRRTGEGEFLSYRDTAHYLVPYVKEMGYTHVELLPVMEHPLDASWGYQVTGYYAPTSRYGTPKDFMYFVNYLHKKGIGIILDWVPAHFPRDAHGLADFDGQPLYEYADPRKGEHPDWGTKVFDYGKNEVKNFLIANALFWVEKFHVDGLRVDAVASMLYLDYGKEDGQWIANKYGGNQNLEAIEFFKHLNSVVLGRNQGTMMIAEESTAWPKVTAEPEYDGLGFSLKWNMGWMHDFTEYMKLDPYFRKGCHNQMTFAMSYAYSEKYVLVLSHDEVVHLKCSMINKMPGLGFDKFANLKAGYAFMMGHSGKKLLFMGQDFAQLREWSEERELDWYLLAEEEHRQMQAFTRDLLHLYKKNKALYECDVMPEGFEWINADDRERSIFSFIRHSKDDKKNLLFVCNFTPVARPDYRVGVSRRKQLRLVLNSDEKQYGGTGAERPVIYKPKKQECDGRPYSIGYDLPPYGVAVFEF